MNVEELKCGDYSFDYYYLNPLSITDNETIFIIDRTCDLIDSVYLELPPDFDKSKLKVSFNVCCSDVIYEENLNWELIKLYYGTKIHKFKNVVPLCFSFCVNKQKLSVSATKMTRYEIKINCKNVKLMVKQIFLDTPLRRQLFENFKAYHFGNLINITNTMIYKILQNKLCDDVAYEIISSLYGKQVFFSKTYINLY
jgi:hypothetical protein